MTFSQLYHQEIEELAALAYRDALKDFSSTQLDRGCREAIKRCTFIPKPADIIDCISDTRPDLYQDFKKLPEPGMSSEDYKKMFSELGKKLGSLSETQKDSGTIEITDEMRERHERNKREALEKFRKGA